MTGNIVIAAALLAACAVRSGGGHADWYEHRHDVVGCMGAATRAGMSPGDRYDSYVGDCVNDRRMERWSHWQPDIHIPTPAVPAPSAPPPAPIAPPAAP